jgi:hypothetical protein
MKKYFLGIVAVVLAIGFSAFKAIKFDPVTFVYTGSTTTLSELSDPTKWVDGGSASFTCGGVDDISCSFQADASHKEPGQNYLNHLYTVDLGADNVIDQIRDASSQAISIQSLTEADLNP